MPARPKAGRKSLLITIRIERLAGYGTKDQIIINLWRSMLLLETKTAGFLPAYIDPNFRFDASADCIGMSRSPS